MIPELKVTAKTEENCPSLWQGALPRPARDDYKYLRGHAVILAAPDLTGATRLAVEACARIGVGIVTVLAEERADIYRTTLPPDIMVSSETLDTVRKPSVLLAGSGGLSTGQTAVLETLCEPKFPRVFDAEAIPLFQPQPTLSTLSVLTPHEGEFSRAFPDVSGDRSQRAAIVAERLGVVLVLKGAETLIAAPGRALVKNMHASPYLAKAGSGDVLAGMITGLIGQGLASFEASCAAVWMHGEAGLQIGPGLMASDIPGRIPGILQGLLG